MASELLPTLCNLGSAFGLPLANVFITIFILVSVSFFLFKNKNTSNNLPLALILAGGFSNLIDRFFRGCVLDFVNFKVWPSFNLADSMITIGVLFLVFNILRGEKHET
jgi:signal peptidase II